MLAVPNADSAEEVSSDGGYTVGGYGVACSDSAAQVMSLLESRHGYGVTEAHFDKSADSGDDSGTSSSSSGSGDEASSDSAAPSEPAPMSHDAVAAVVSFVMQTNTRVPALLLQHLEALPAFQRETEKAKRQISASVVNSGDREGRSAMSEYVWATRYSEAVAESDPQRQLTLLSTLREDFLDACKLYGSVICIEACLPDYRKTIKPVALGGVAGGSKFKTAAILFKFARDPFINGTEFLYGGVKADEEAARKAMGNELKAAGALYKAADGTVVQVPLMAILDYRGFRLCCQAVLPIAGGHLVYGSSDGGLTANDGAASAELKRDVATISSRLNLALHPVKEFSTGTVKEVSLPVDIEIHQVMQPDGVAHYYALDVARLMPPTAPARGAERRIFCQMFRPEFVRQYREALSSDCFSRFGLPGAAVHDKRNAEATLHLVQTVIPAFAAGLTNSLDRISFRFHEAGINMRFMGLVRHHSSNEVARRVLLEQMMARVLKKRLEEQLRNLVASTKAPLTYPYQELAATFFAECAGASKDAPFWRTAKKAILAKFGKAALSEEESKKDFLLLYAIRSLDHVLHALADMAGIRVRRALVNVAEMTFLPTDFAFEPVIKEMQISTVAMAQSLVMQASNHRGEVREELLREAVQVLGNEAAQSPNDVGVVLKLVYAQVALCFDTRSAPKPMSEQTATLVATMEPRLLAMAGALDGAKQLEPLYLLLQLYGGQCRALIASESIAEAARVWRAMFKCAERLATIDADGVQLYFLKLSEACAFLAEVQTHVLEVMAELFALVTSHDDVERLNETLSGIWNRMTASQLEAVLVLAASVQSPYRHAPHVTDQRSMNAALTHRKTRRTTLQQEVLTTPSFRMAACLSRDNAAPAGQVVRQYLARFPVIVFRGLASMPVDDKTAAVILRFVANPQCGLDFSGCRVTDALAQAVGIAPTHLDVCGTSVSENFLFSLGERKLLAALKYLYVDDSSCTLDLPDMVTLDTLSAAYCDLDADTLISFSRRASTAFPALRALDLSFTACITRESLEALSASVPLQMLNVSSSCAAPAMEHLSLSSLRSLQMASCHLTDAALASVCMACPQLSTLDVCSNAALTNSVVDSVGRLALLSLKMSRCTLLSDAFLNAMDATPVLSGVLCRLELFDCPLVSSTAVRAHMDTHPMRLVLGGSGASLAQAVLLDDGEDEASAAAASLKAGRSTTTLSASAVASALRMLRAHHQKEGCAVVFAGGSAVAVDKLMQRTCKKFEVSVALRPLELWHRCDSATGATNVPYASFMGLLRELFGVPRSCSARFVAQWVDLQARRLCDPAVPSALLHTRQALQLLLMGRSSEPAIALASESGGEGGVDDPASLLGRARSIALSQFKTALERAPVAVMALQSLAALDAESDALLAELLAAKLPRCVWLLSCSAPPLPRARWAETLGASCVMHMVHVLADEAVEMKENTALPVMVAQLPDMLRRTLFAACVLDRSVDVAAVAHILGERLRTVEEHLTMLTLPQEPQRVQLVQAWQQGHFVVPHTVRLMCVALLEQSSTQAVSMYLRASQWLERSGSQPLLIVELLQRSMSLSAHDNDTLRFGYLSAVLRAASSLGVSDSDRAREMLRAADSHLAAVVAHDAPLSMRRVALQLLQKHVQLLFVPWGVCMDLAEAERLLRAQERLRDVFASDEQLEAMYVDQASCALHRNQLFALPAKGTAMTADRHDFAQCVPLRSVVLRQLSLEAGPCGSSPLVARLSLHVRELTLQGRWRAAQNLLDEAQRVCDSSGDAEHKLVALACTIEAAALHKGLIGDIAGAVDAALTAHEELVSLFPLLPVHPLVEHLFLPLSLFVSDPDSNLVAMLRQMDRFAQCIPLFHLEALVLVGQCMGVPTLLRKQVGLELLHHESVLGNKRYHAFALCMLGEAAQSVQMLERAAHAARESQQDFLELTCIKALLPMLTDADGTLWNKRHDALWSALQEENEAAAVERRQRTMNRSSGLMTSSLGGSMLRSPSVMHIMTAELPGARRRSHTTESQASPRTRKYGLDLPPARAWNNIDE